MQKKLTMRRIASKRLLTAAMAIVAMMPAFAINYEKTDRGVTVHVTQTNDKGTSPKLVRLQVMGDRIIRVSATADKQFADRQKRRRQGVYTLPMRADSCRRNARNLQGMEHETGV